MFYVMQAFSKEVTFKLFGFFFFKLGQSVGKRKNIPGQGNIICKDSHVNVTDI
jgi:hypothetical protein